MIDLSPPEPPGPVMRSSPRSHCVVWGSQGLLLHSGLEDRLFGARGTWSFRRCEAPGCGVLWLDPFPIEEDLHLAYASYYTHGDSGGRGSAGAVCRLVVRLTRVADSILKRVSGLAAARRRIDLMFLDEVEPGRLLEVGCGDGRRLARFRERGWQVVGQEIDERAAAVARSRVPEIRTGPLETLGLEPGSFDAVVANHVLEHVADPLGLLRQCRSLLRPGGRLVLATPNPSGDGHARFGRHWFGLDPPRHLHLFPPAAGRRMAEQAGFRAIEARGEASRAYSFATGSASIARTGRFAMNADAAGRDHVAGLLFQYAGWFRSRWRPDGGDETILIAVAGPEIA
jgi:SAM-dependent methyltransferase